ncbi:MAG: SCO family protein [Alphaproteobacteria bacterium]|nr:SCO family protein [Alphaproteobacteria bacterium]
MRRIFASPLFIALAAGVAAAVVAGYVAWIQVAGRTTEDGRVVSFTPQVALGGDFSLTDHDGRPVTLSSFDGKNLLVYFGYTYCPDFCATDTAVMAAVMDEVAEQAPEIGAALQPLFITIDPDRDTAAVLKEYAGAFHPRIVGLTGTETQIADAAESYRVYYAKQAPREDPDDYLVDHSTFTYLTGGDGAVTTVFPNNTPPEAIAKAIIETLD